MKKKPAFLLSLFLALTLLLSGCDSQYGVTVVTTPQTPAASSAPLAPEAPNPPEAPDQEGAYVERYLEGAAIGGDRFGNREGLLPQEDGRRYTECDLNTDGASSRGAERLIFSNDGLCFYTENHYESFLEVWVEDGEVVLGCEPFV